MSTADQIKIAVEAAVAAAMDSAAKTMEAANAAALVATQKAVDAAKAEAFVAQQHAVAQALQAIQAPVGAVAAAPGMAPPMAAAAFPPPAGSAQLALPGGAVLPAMQPRLLSILSAAQVSDINVQRLTSAGITSAQVFGSIADSRQGFRDFLRDVIHLDPTKDPAAYVSVANLIAAFDAAGRTTEIEGRAAAERQAAFLPPRLHDQDLDTVRKAFHLEEFILGDEAAPSKAYFERKVAELDSIFTAEPLTLVTTKSSADNNLTTNVAADEASGLLKLTTKSHGIRLPTDDSSFHLRMRSLAVCWTYPKIGSQRGVLCCSGSHAGQNHPQ